VCVCARGIQCHVSFMHVCMYVCVDVICASVCASVCVCVCVCACVYVCVCVCVTGKSFIDQGGGETCVY